MHRGSSWMDTEILRGERRFTLPKPANMRTASAAPITLRAIAFPWLALALMFPASISLAGGIDHVVTFDQSGIWNRNIQKGLEYTLIGGEIAGALWLGGDDGLGKTFWQAIDSSSLAGITTEAMKRIFTRARPDQGGDPHKWFQGSGHYSFP